MMHYTSKQLKICSSFKLQQHKQNYENNYTKNNIRTQHHMTDIPQKLTVVVGNFSQLIFNRYNLKPINLLINVIIVIFGKCILHSSHKDFKNNSNSYHQLHRRHSAMDLSFMTGSEQAWCLFATTSGNAGAIKMLN